MSPTIRKATAADESALSRICLLTADAGKSAEALHDHKELPGLVYSVPYVHLPTTYAFVLVDGDVVVGYIVGSKDTRAYEQHAEEDWWPKHAERFPPNAMVREADKKYAAMLQKMPTADRAKIAFSPAHLHINILEGYQGKGFGRELIKVAVEHLKTEGLPGVWLGLDPRNTGARKFYRRVGFSSFEGADSNTVGLSFK